jgi:hypothetical protein
MCTGVPNLELRSEDRPGKVLAVAVVAAPNWYYVCTRWDAAPAGVRCVEIRCVSKEG